MLDHLANRIGDKKRVKRTRHQLAVVLILYGEEIVFGDPNRNRATAGVGLHRAADVGPDRTPGTLWLRQRLGMAGRRIEVGILVDIVKIHRRPGRRNHFVAPVVEVTGQGYPHRPHLDRRIHGAHGRAKGGVTGMSADAVDIFRTVTRPHCFPTVGLTLRTATGWGAAIDLVAHRPQRNADWIGVAVGSTQLRPVTCRLPVETAAIYANSGRVRRLGVEKGYRGGGFLGRTIGADHPHALFASGLQEVDKVGWFSGPILPTITTGQRIRLIGAHFATEPAIGVAVAAAWHADHRDARSSRAGAEGGVGKIRWV